MKNNNCELCRLVFDNEIKTKLIYKDELITITYCDTCKNVPIVVLNSHETNINFDTVIHVEKICAKLFPDCKFRGYIRKIKNHWHDHILIN